MSNLTKTDNQGYLLLNVEFVVGNKQNLTMKTLKFGFG